MTTSVFSSDLLAYEKEDFQDSVLADGKSNARGGMRVGREIILLKGRNVRPCERYSGFCDTMVLYVSNASCNCRLEDSVSQPSSSLL